MGPPFVSSRLVMGRKSLNGHLLLPNRLAGRRPPPKWSPTMAGPSSTALPVPLPVPLLEKTPRTSVRKGSRFFWYTFSGSRRKAGDSRPQSSPGTKCPNPMAEDGRPPIHVKDRSEFVSPKQTGPRANPVSPRPRRVADPSPAGIGDCCLNATVDDCGPRRTPLRRFPAGSQAPVRGLPRRP